MTWAEWKDLVGEAYRSTSENNPSIYRAIAAFVKGQITREVDRDIPLSRSYRNDYAMLRVAFAGTSVTEDLATISPKVLRLLTVDANRAAIQNFISDSIQQAMDEINADVALYSAALLEAAIHIQEHVEAYQQGHETFYVDDDVSNVGAISLGQLPAGCIPEQMSFLKYAPALAESIAYSIDDLVASNQRIYKVVTAGTISAGQLGDGLTSTDASTVETLGGVGFVFVSAIVDVILGLTSWDRRRPLMQANPDSPAIYVWGIDGTTRQFFACPKLDSEHQLCLEWRGVKQDFEDNDAVPFDVPAARAAAEYIRGQLHTKIDGDAQQAGIAETRYREKLRGLSASSLSAKAGV